MADSSIHNLDNCSIIIGQFGLGGNQIIGQFGLNVGCVSVSIPPIISSVISGGGGGNNATSSFLVPFVQNSKQCNRTAMVTIKFTTDKVWRRMYAVNVCNDSKLIVTSDIINTTNKPTIDIYHITNNKLQVTTKFNLDDK